MFEARLKPAGVLKAILKAIKDLVPDALLECSRDGVAMQTMDSAHVALVQFLLDAEAFEKYRCDRSLRLGINIGSLYSIIELAKKDDALVLSARANTQALRIRIVGKRRVAEFSLKLLSIESDILEIPETTHHSTIAMPARQFRKVCEDLSAVGDAVRIETKKDGRVVFQVEGDLGRGKVTYSESDSEPWEEVKVEVNDPIHQSFSLGYLNWIAKATPLSNYATLRLNREAPMRVDYPIEYPLRSNKARRYGYMSYWLAAKIDD